jgi:hypothetical protein
LARLRRGLRTASSRSEAAPGPRTARTTAFLIIFLYEFPSRFSLFEIEYLVLILIELFYELAFLLRRTHARTSAGPSPVRTGRRLLSARNQEES